MTRFLCAVFSFLTAVGLAAGGEPAAKGFFFKDGDTIVMMGDSITEQLLYSNYVEMWTVSRFPKWNLTFRNVGIGGDTAGGGNGRFKRDVLPYQATAMTVDFGMNDGRYLPFDEDRFNTYLKGLQGIADQAKAANVRVAWVTPQPVEHNPGDKKESYNETLEKFSDGVRQTAEKNGGLFVDQFHPYWAVVKGARDAGNKGRITHGDAVHPGPSGQVIMASAILKGLRFPRTVSSITVSGTAAQGEVDGENCKIKIRGVRQADGAFVFDRSDNALPFFPEQAKDILKWAPLLEDMNHLGLTVKDLPKGQYEIRLDDKKVGEYSAEELAKGVNLAAAALAVGPVADRVKNVWQAVKGKNQYFHDQVFRGVVLANAKSPVFKGVDPKEIAAKRQELIAERMKKMPELDAAVRQALEVRSYEVAVVPLRK